MGKPRTLTRLGPDRIRQAIASTPSLRAAARTLGVDHSALSRWTRRQRAAEGPSRPLRLVEGGPAPAARPDAPGVAVDWAAEIRREFVLSPAHERVLVLAEQAFALARAETESPSVRLAASREYTRLMTLLGLEESDAATPTTTRPYLHGA